MTKVWLKEDEQTRRHGGRQYTVIQATPDKPGTNKAPWGKTIHSHTGDPRQARNKQGAMEEDNTVIQATPDKPGTNKAPWRKTTHSHTGDPRQARNKQGAMEEDNTQSYRRPQTSQEQTRRHGGRQYTVIEATPDKPGTNKAPWRKTIHSHTGDPRQARNKDEEGTHPIYNNATPIIGYLIHKTIPFDQSLAT